MKKCRMLLNKLWCHVGMGRFNRSHQSKCIDMIRKWRDKEYSDWSIIGVGISRQDKSTIYNLRNQNHRYTLKEVSSEYSIVSVVDSITDTIYIPDEKEKLNTLLTDDLKGVSVTITENGYHLDSNGVLFMSEDVKSDSNIMMHNRPYTIYGFLHYLLYHRYLLNLPGIYVMSCDNIIKNSAVLRTGFFQFLNTVHLKKDRERYLNWIENEVTFPITMVDRITPNVCNREYIYKKHGIDDKCNVTSETYLKWVIEDEFVSKSGYRFECPPLELVDGVVIDKNIDVHERMKIKFVNGGHLIIAFYGMMNDCVYVTEAMKNEECCRLLDEYFNSVCKTFTKEERITYDIMQYIENVKERFENIHILDTIERLSLHGGTKVIFVMNDLVIDTDIDISNSIYIPIRMYFEYLNRMKHRLDFLVKYDMIGMTLLNSTNNNKDRINKLFFH